MNEIESKPNNRIIVIDDDPEIWEAYRAILSPALIAEQFRAGKKMDQLFAGDVGAVLEEQINFDLSFASQGQEGFQLVQKALQKENPYAIAFVDVRMPPGWDGLETAANIRSIDPDIEIVIVTAYADRSRDEIAQAVKPPHKLLYLRKPFDLDELKQIALSLSEKWNISQLEQEQRETITTILKTTPAAIFTTDEKRRITSWNQAAEQITGYRAEEVLGRMCIFKDIARDEICRKCAPLASVSHSKQNLEISFQDKAGELRSISMNVSPLQNKKGENIGNVESFWDITERKRLELEKFQLEERNHQAHKLEALGTLAGGIAHDFNNILTPIIGYAQLGELNLERNQLEKVKESFHIIRNSANSASELTKQILAYSRQQVLDIRRINLSSTVNTMSKMLHRLIREDIRLEFDLAKDTMPIKADAGRLGQILMNLVVNARDAISTGGHIAINSKNVIIPAASPLIDAEKNPFSGSFVLLEVIDNGAGMDQKTLERIFDPFFTTKPMGAGTGIGLSTVFGIVKQHGGHILMQSQPGQGTTVQIYFKVEEKERSEDEYIKNKTEIKEGSETILVVEDSKEVLAAITMGLKTFGYNIIEADGSEKAIRTIHECKEKIHMLITDVVMPGLSGKAVAETFRIKFDDLPILFISGYSSEVNPEDLNTIKNSYFLQKPFGPTQIAGKVRAILDGKERIEE